MIRLEVFVLLLLMMLLLLVVAVGVHGRVSGGVGDGSSRSVEGGEGGGDCHGRGVVWVGKDGGGRSCGGDRGRELEVGGGGRGGGGGGGGGSEGGGGGDAEGGVGGGERGGGDAAEADAGRGGGEGRFGGGEEAAGVAVAVEVMVVQPDSNPSDVASAV